MNGFMFMLMLQSRQYLHLCPSLAANGQACLLFYFINSIMHVAVRGPHARPHMYKGWVVPIQAFGSVIELSTTISPTWPKSLRSLHDHHSMASLRRWHLRMQILVDRRLPIQDDRIRRLPN